MKPSWSSSTLPCLCCFPGIQLHFYFLQDLLEELWHYPLTHFGGAFGFAEFKAGEVDLITSLRILIGIASL